MAIAAGTLIPCCMAKAEAMPARAMMEPTDRSMPPVRMTNSSPNATMATNETCLETRKRL